MHTQGQHKQHDSRNTGNQNGPGDLNRLAFTATIHCLSGCAIGEVAGMVVGTAFAWSNAVTVAFSIVLAFISGYALTMLPLLRGGMMFAVAARLALASDTVSIMIMEIVDNVIVV